VPTTERFTLTGRIVQVQVAVVGELYRRLAERGFDDLRPSSAPVFQHIAPEGSRLSELADRAGVTRQSLAEQIAALERSGYIARRPDPGDRRARLIVLTDRGWQAVDAGLSIISEVEAGWARDLGPKLHGALTQALERVAEAPLGSPAGSSPTRGPRG
jgi:DNA-binding MarR family transcriptional regulator